MKLHPLAFLLATLACATRGMAENYSWRGDGGAPYDWTNAANWFDLTDSTSGVAPVAGDLAIIGSPAAGYGANPRPVINTVLYTPAAPLQWLGMDWWNEVDSAPENPGLTIAAGGGLEVNYTWMNAGGQETATIHITGGGYLRSWVHMQMGMTAGGTSRINIDSGFVYTPTLIFGPGNSNIDIEPGGTLFLAGDQTTQAATWISQGKITGGGGAMGVQAVFNTPIAGLTAVQAVQISGPISIANSGFEVDNVPDNTASGIIPTSWTWQPFVGPGVATYVIDKAFLGGAPHSAGIAGAHLGNQYYIGHAGGTGAVPLIHQDTSLLWSYLAPGDTLTFAVWAAYRSDYPGNNAVTLWLNFWDDVSNGTDITTINSPNFNVSSTGTSAPGEWTQYVWNHVVTQADIEEAALEGWGNVNVAISFYGSEGSQVAFDDVSLVRTPGPLQIATLEPADNSVNIPVATKPTVTFSRAVALTGTGSITLKNLSGGADIPTTLPGDVSIIGRVLTFNPSSNMVAGQEYAVEITADTIKDLSDPAESFPGLLATDTPNWNFTASPAGAHVKVFLLGGQSNAVGTPPTSGLPTSPVNLQKPQADVLFYANYPAPGLTTLRPGSGGNSASFGPEVGFGRAVADASPGTTYAIIKHAVGATNLYNQWAPGTGVIYSDFRGTVAAGLAALHAEGYTTEIVGMLWHQGESDAIEGEQANYQTNLTNFIADIRTRYGANLPFLIGEIVHYNAAFVTVITAQQAAAAADPWSVWVPANDLTFMDALHFDAVGQITLGQRFAAGYATLVPPGGDFADWIDDPSYGIDPGKRALHDDPDGDGIDNGVENFFGTHPGTFSQGIVAGVKSENTFTFTHPISGTPASDLTAAYRWSKDLATFTPDDVAHEGSTVTLTPGTPSGGFVTVTATVTGTPLDRLFVDVMVTQE